MRRSVRVLSAVVVGSTVIAACGSSTTTSGSGATSLSGNSLLYGASPEQSSAITYQPDVVFVGGADSIKSVSSDGLIWTISGSAPNVNELAPGKVMFASSLGVGEVLAVSQVGGNKQVVLGPANITDIVKDGDFSSKAPMSLDSPEAYTVPDQPGLLSQTPASTSSASTISVPAVHFLAYIKGQVPPAYASPAIELASGGSLPPPTRAPASSDVGGYQLTPFCCSGGMGVHVSYDNNNGLTMSATVTLKLQQPTVTFDLNIKSGKIVTAGVVLHGAGGLAIKVVAASTTGLSGNVARQRVQIPVDFSVPVFGLPIPITLGLQQVFGLTTAFTAKDSTFTATGQYAFGGALGFGLNNGSYGVYTPKNFDATTPISTNMALVSIGPASLIVDYAARFSVGVGLLGFRTGLWFEISFAFGMTESGLSAEFVCRLLSLAVFADYGIGWRIPAPVAALISTFLKLFNAPPVQSMGGYTAPSVTVLEKSSTNPPIAACASS